MLTQKKKTFFFGPCDVKLKGSLCKFHINEHQVFGDFVITHGILTHFVHGMPKTNSVKWCIQTKGFTWNHELLNGSNVPQIRSLICYVAQDLGGETTRF